jgi:hypothetical protein
MGSRTGWLFDILLRQRGSTMAHGKQLTGLLGAICLAAYCLPALAADESTPEQARRLFQEGLSAAANHQYEAALRNFEAASALHPSAAITFNTASALFELHRYVDAYRSLRRLADFPALPALSQARVEALGRALRGEVSLVSVHIAGGAEPLQLRIDDKTYVAASPQDPVPVKPGVHAVEAIQRGKVIAQRELTLSGGEHTSLELGLSCMAQPPSRTAQRPKTASSNAAVGNFPDWFKLVDATPRRDDLEPKASAERDPRTFRRRVGIAAATVVLLVVATPFVVNALTTDSGSSPSGGNPNGFAPGALTW